MYYNDFLQKRRSIRKYQDKPVSTDLIKEMIQEATFAPSAGNGQPWKLIIIQDRDLMDEISADCKKSILNRIKHNPGDYAEKYQKMLQNDSYNVFYNAPCLVMILGPAKLKNIRVDCALFASYFMMAAVSRDLGTCWVNFATEIQDQELRKRIGIPDDCSIVAPLIVGYPERITPAPLRKKPAILNVIE